MKEILIMMMDIKMEISGISANWGGNWQYRLTTFQRVPVESWEF